MTDFFAAELLRAFNELLCTVNLRGAHSVQHFPNMCHQGAFLSFQRVSHEGVFHGTSFGKCCSPGGWGEPFRRTCRDLSFYEYLYVLSIPRERDAKKNSSEDPNAFNLWQKMRGAGRTDLQDLERLCRGRGIRLSLKGRVHVIVQKDIPVEEHHHTEIPGMQRGQRLAPSGW